MTALERKLRAILKVLLDECTSNPSFHDRLFAVLNGMDEPARHDANKSASEAGSGSEKETPRATRASGSSAPASARRPGRRPRGPFDPFAIYQAGQDRDPLKERESTAHVDGDGTLRSRLVELDEDQLKDIIAEHSMDPSRLAMKWKDPDRLIDLIVKVVVQRRRKGEAFLDTGFRVRVSDAVYVNDWQALIVGLEISNRGPADTITAIELRIGDRTFTCSMPDGSKSIPRVIGTPPRRIDQNDGIDGALYFGPSLDGGSAMPMISDAELIIRRASGATQRSQVTVRSREHAEQ